MEKIKGKQGIELWCNWNHIYGVKNCGIVHIYNIQTINNQASAERKLIGTATINNQIPYNSQQKPKTEIAKAHIPQIKPANKQNPKQTEMINGVR